MISLCRINPIKNTTDYCHTRKGNGEFNYIPLSNVCDLFKIFQKIRKELPNPKKSKMKFLDVGCGPGNILFTALSCFQNFNWEFHGIENEKYYADLAKMLTGTFKSALNDRSKSIKIFNEDALRFKNYGDYDVIYFYRPISNRNLQRRLEKRIERQMKVGCYYIPILKTDPVTFKKNVKFEKLSFPINVGVGPVFKKVMK